MDAPIGYMFDRESRLEQENTRLRRELEEYREGIAAIADDMMETWDVWTKDGFDEGEVPSEIYSWAEKARRLVDPEG
jgi:hypothetical protein